MRGTVAKSIRRLAREWGDIFTRDNARALEIDYRREWKRKIKRDGDPSYKGWEQPSLHRFTRDERLKEKGDG